MFVKAGRMSRTRTISNKRTRTGGAMISDKYRQALQALLTRTQSPPSEILQRTPAGPWNGFPG